MSTPPEGPFLYDDGPSSPHTGTPRSRNGLLLGIMLATVLVGVAMVLLLPVVKGSPEEQSTAAVTVFYDSLGDGDLDTATQMLCSAERNRLADADPGEDYLLGDGPEVTGATDADEDGDTVQHVTVRWDDGSTATVTVVAEDGPRVCGISG
ncbi:MULTISPECIES: Rv0361 family membrane protein [unclassified Blastococcus]